MYYRTCYGCPLTNVCDLKVTAHHAIRVLHQTSPVRLTAVAFECDIVANLFHPGQRVWIRLHWEEMGDYAYQVGMSHLAAPCPQRWEMATVIRYSLKHRRFLVLADENLDPVKDRSWVRFRPEHIIPSDEPDVEVCEYCGAPDDQEHSYTCPHSESTEPGDDYDV